MILARTVLCVVALLISVATSEAWAQARRVLLLHSFGPDFSPWGEMAASFRADLVRYSSEPIDLYEASVFAARFTKPEGDEPFVAYLRALFFDRKVDLIVTMGAPATYFVQRNRSSVFGDTPLLITGLEQRRIPDTSLRPNDAVVALEIDLKRNIENILRLLPATKAIVVAIGDSQLEQYWVDEMRREFQAFESRVNFSWLNKLSLDGMLKEVARLPSQTAIFHFIVAVDTEGVPYAQARALEALHAATNAPIFGYADYELGRGIVGGPLLPAQELGRRAAAVGLRILKGEAPGSIKTPPLGLTVPTYDWRELQRWNISEARLPAGSVVLNRAPTMWHQYWWQIMLTGAAVVTQSLLIAGLLYQRQRRRRAEVEAHRRMGELALMNRRSAIGAMSATLAHEIKQPLSAIVTNANVGLRWLAKETPDAVEATAALKRIAAEALRADKVVVSTRAMFKKDDESRELLAVNDVIRDVLGLLRIELDERNVTVRTALSDGPQRVSANRTQLQQVILNLARNAIEAMAAVTDRPRILKLATAGSESTEFIVIIEDSGPGVDPQVAARLFEPFVTTKSSGMGMGLSICRSIVEAHDGRLSVAAASPHGAVFEIALPLS